MKNYSVKTQISICILFVALISFSIIGFYSYITFKNNLEYFMGQRALDLVKSISANIDGDAIRRYDEGGEKDEQYQQILSYLSSQKKLVELSYLYVITDAGDEYKYIVEGFIEGENMDNIMSLGETQVKDEYGPEPQEALETGTGTYSSLYDNGQFGILLSGFAPIFDSEGKIVGLLGLDISASIIQESLNSYTPVLITIMAGICIFVFLVIQLLLHLIVTKPLKLSADLALKLSKGDFDANVPRSLLNKNNELGFLARAIETLKINLIRIKKDIALIESKQLIVSDEGDIEGEFKSIKTSICQIVNSYDSLLSDFSQLAEELSDSSRQVADISNHLAVGASQQASSIESFDATLSMLSEMADKNNDSVRSVTEYASHAEESFEKYGKDMLQVVGAMNDIYDVSFEISKIMDDISEIAEMTNILAINASIESARAGAAGKGFAVVAEEVRSLAAKSAQAAKKSDDLVQKSIKAVERGKSITEDTDKALHDVSDKFGLVLKSVSDISATSSEQARGIIQIKEGIGQISVIVRGNSEKAEDSAAASRQLSAQAQTLGDKINEYVH